MNDYEAVIGLEVHVELKTKSKMFCGCSADYFSKEPNSHTCPVCLGLPGALPVPNKQAIEWCVLIGMALNCEIPMSSKFDRKNYFYPDLAKGYQISQYDEPFAINGWIDLKSEIQNKNLKRNGVKLEHPEGVNSEGVNSEGVNSKLIRIRRVHMEEDTGKLIHAEIGGEKVSLIDFNRSGVALVEIVTEPDFENANQVVTYLKKLQQIVRYLNVSNADMEKGDMRLEPNISLTECHPERSEKSQDFSLSAQNDKGDLPPYKVEIKNINSFKFVEKAINYELNRQKKLLHGGKLPQQETRGWDDKKHVTVSQRVKEEANDYRYFPEPDIPPVKWEAGFIESLKSQMPELPDAKFKRFQQEYGLSDYNCEILTRETSVSDYFEEAVKVGKDHSVSSKQIANTIINKKIAIDSVLPTELIKSIIASSQTTVIDAQELEKIIEEVLQQNEKAVLDYKSGKESVIMFLVGQVMKNSSKRLDAKLVKIHIIKVINGS